MSEHVSGLAEVVEPIFRKAMACNACFTCQGSTLQRAPVDIAQPRPTSDDYWTSEVRIALMLINPGAGGGEHAGGVFGLRSGRGRAPSADGITRRLVPEGSASSNPHYS
jgi:hypothetical protein